MNRRLQFQLNGDLSTQFLRKLLRKSKTYRAHDPKNSFKEGDQVRIQECAPVSKSKRWEVLVA